MTLLPPTGQLLEQSSCERNHLGTELRQVPSSNTRHGWAGACRLGQPELASQSVSMPPTSLCRFQAGTILVSRSCQKHGL